MTRAEYDEAKELIKETTTLQEAALDNKWTSDVRRDKYADIAEKYRLAAQHFADGAKLCADKVSSIIKTR